MNKQTIELLARLFGRFHFLKGGCPQHPEGEAVVVPGSLGWRDVQDLCMAGVLMMSYDTSLNRYIVRPALRPIPDRHEDGAIDWEPTNPAGHENFVKLEKKITKKVYTVGESKPKVSTRKIK